ncbi:hypothetical protein ACSBR2_015553 [Camellia fascicularis]
MDQYGGWVPVVRQRGRQEREKNEGCASVFTIFVDNIPISVNPKGLHNLFTKFGVVKDVFIPNKRRRITNIRFAFVRKQGGKRTNRASASSGKKSKWPTREDRRWIEVSTDHKSYAEAIIGKTQGGRDNITVKADEIGNGWLYKSVVVRLKENYVNTNLKKEIEAMGVEDVLERNVWLSCYGIPLNLWNNINVKRIGGLWGKFICYEGDMNQPRSYVCAKLKISTNCMEPINKVVNLECKGMIHSVRVCEEQVVLAKMTKMVCQCQKNQELEELGSSNAIDEHGMERGNSAEDRDDDLESDSDHALALLDDVAIDIKALGGRKSEEVEQEVCCKSDTIVAESRSGAGMVVGMGNHNIELSTDTEACRLMMGMGKHNVGSAVGNWKSQSMDNHVPTPGYIRSLGRTSPSRPGIDIEVVLGHNQGLSQGFGLQQAQQCKNGLKGQTSSIKEGNGEAGLAVRSSSVSEDKEVEPNNRPVNSKKRIRRSVPKAAVWRAAVAAISLSTSVENGLDKGRCVLNEAQATLKMGEVLGVQFNGKEDEVLKKIVGLELNDQGRIRRGDSGGA